MELKLNEQYRVTSDSRQYILQRFTEGNEIRANIGYYGTIDQLVNSLLEREIKTSKIGDLQALAEMIDELVDEIYVNVDFYNNYRDVSV